MSLVLVVDDEPANRELLKLMLAKENYRIAFAEDGQTALSEFARIKPDLVLLDIRMPKLDGIEVCRKLKSHPESRLTPVVLVTGTVDSADRLRGIEAGADDFLNKPVDKMELIARVRSLLSLKAYTDELEHAETVLFALARSIEAKDPYTEGHCERLSEYSAALGQKIGLPDHLITALKRAGIVHDLGKVGVPDSILLKPGPLTPEEWLVMKQHPIVGESICKPLKSFSDVLPIIRHHHEKCDGSGYPDGLRKDEIPVTARVLATVDVFDALTTERPYRKALSPQEAFATMYKEAQRGWWDTAMVSEFETVLANLESKAPDQRGSEDRKVCCP